LTWYLAKDHAAWRTNHGQMAIFAVTAALYLPSKQSLSAIAWFLICCIVFSALPLDADEYGEVLTSFVVCGRRLFWIARCSTRIAGSLSVLISTWSCLINVMNLQAISAMKSTLFSDLLGVDIAAG
jgi:hypothetical protein